MNSAVSGDATEGEVLVDGVNVKDMDLYELRDNIGMAMRMLHFSTMRDITHGPARLSFEEGQKAYRADAKLSFIQVRRTATDTIVGERGAVFSGGQETAYFRLPRPPAWTPAILIL